MEAIPLRIAALGRYAPARVVTAAELDERMGLPTGWTMRRTGVTERRWADGETPVDMAAAAVTDALARADLGPDDIDVLMYASATPHQAIPDTAALLQRRLGWGAGGVESFSVHSTCLSFLTALDVAASHIASGRRRSALIAGAEVPSLAADFEHPESAALLGDMATAAVVTAAPPDGDSRLESMVLATYGDGADLCRIEGAGANKPPQSPSTKPEDYLFRMEGPDLVRMAYRLLPPVLNEALERAGIGMADVDLVVPHQASLRGIRLIQRVFGVPDDRVVINLQWFGNCVSASIPGALYDAVEAGRLTRGDVVLLVGTGAGVSVGAGVLVW